MRHTPAPWAAEFVVPQHSADGYWRISAPSADSIVIADLAENPETDANARLITAAPDLLAAAVRAVSTIPAQTKCEARSALIQLYNAIAKAKGAA